MNFTIDVITSADDSAICQIIKTVGAEFGAIGDGFGPSDTEVLNMSKHYQDHLRSRYFIAKMNGEIVGGGGIAPFGEHAGVCELKKLFLLPPARGKGIGRSISIECLSFAQAQGFNRCYLDTLENMTSAIKLYEALGFEHLDAPLAGTEHNGCDVWMLKTFNEQ